MNDPDPYLRYAISTWPIGGFVLLDRLLCRCEGTCTCETEQPPELDEEEIHERRRYRR